MGVVEASTLLPLLYAGGANAAIQGAMSAFGGSDIEDISGFAAKPGDYLDPRMHAEQFLRDLYQQEAIRAGEAAQPVTSPGAFAQPAPYYTGGGLPIPIGVTAQDPALFAPGVHQMRPGFKLGTPDYAQLADWSGEYAPEVGTGKGDTKFQSVSAAPATTKRWMGGEYAPRRDLNVLDFDRGTPEAWGALSQPQASQQVQVGGGVPQLRANLELLGVTTNPQTGMFETQQAPTGPTANPQLFQGSLAWNPRGGVDQGAVQGSPFGGGPGLQANYQGQERKAGVGV